MLNADVLVDYDNLSIAICVVWSVLTLRNNYNMQLSLL